MLIYAILYRYTLRYVISQSSWIMAQDGLNYVGEYIRLCSESTNSHWQDML